MGFLYAAIGIEALLDTPPKDITESLANKLSYLIGQSRSERTKLHDTFRAFYRYRSDIVHGKNAHLPPKGVEMLAWGKTSLKRALARELGLLDKIQEEKG